MLSLSCLLYTVNPSNPHVSPENPENPAVTPPRWDAIPPELKAASRWILWQAKPKPNSLKLDKIPIDPRTGRVASAHDKSIWLTFEQVRLDFEQTTKADGIGFVLGDGCAGVDLDDCCAPNEPLSKRAQGIISRLATYTETSPSGRGVKAFLKGKKPGPRCDLDDVEIYDSGRFFTVTGRHVEGTPRRVEERQAELEALYHSTFGSAADRSGQSRKDNHTQGINLLDVEILNMLSYANNGAKFRRLFSGDWGDYYPSESEADCGLLASLLWGTQHNEATAIRLFEGSPFYQQKDDDHKRKWERDDYRQRTIEKALDGLGKYDPNYRSSGNGSHKSASRESGKPSGNGNAKQYQSAPETPTPESTPETESPPEMMFTEGWTAGLFVKRHGQDLRYCYQWREWLVWDGKRWKSDNTGEVWRRAKETIRSLYAEAAKMEDDPARKARIQHAFKYDNNNKYKAVVELAKCELPITPLELDSDPMLLNCQNGTVDLTTGERRSHRRSDFITKLCPVDFDIDTTLTLFDDFLAATLPDLGTRAFVRRAMGYSATGHAKEEVLFFPFGPTATGKSTLLAAVQAALGDYAATADFETLLAQKGVSGRPKTELARLQGKRFVVSVEVNRGVKLAEGLVKWITGQDKVVARHLYGKEFEFLPSFTLWLAANHRPHANDEDDALWRRIQQIPFDQQVKKPSRDPTLKQRLCDPKIAGAAILAWVVKGGLEYQQRGLDVPEVVEHTTEEYRQEMNPLSDFLNDCCVVLDSAITTSEALWDAYSKWADENGIKYPLKRRAFGQRLESMGFRNGREYVSGVQQRVFWGIGILTEDEQDTRDAQDTTSYNFSNNPTPEEKLQDVASYVSYASCQSKNDSKPKSEPQHECGQPEQKAGDKRLEAFLTAWYTEHSGSYIKGSTAWEIAQSVGFEIHKDLSNVMGRVYILAGGEAVRVSPVVNSAGRVQGYVLREADNFSP